MDEFAQYQLRVADITRDANSGLWNALLTLDGIIVSVFSAVAVFRPTAKSLAFIIVAISMLSAMLLTLNFRSTRNQYRLLGQLSEGGVEYLSDDDRRRQIARSERAHLFCVYRETATLYILAVQALLILGLIYSKS